jgi:hypothetical protein
MADLTLQAERNAGTGTALCECGHDKPALRGAGSARKRDDGYFFAPFPAA